MAGKATRQSFGETVARLGAEMPEIVVLEADLGKSTKSELFGKKFPDRYFQMGIAEANMIGTAAGLAFTGKIPFACSFGCFITGRYDTIRLSAAYSQANLRLVGTHAGIGIGDDGHSQMGLEDVSLMRSLPTMGVFQPMDARETELVVEYLCREWKGPAYLRLTRQSVPDLFPANGVFQAGKLMEIRKPQGVPRAVCIATGATVIEAVRAAEALEAQGIAMSVWNAHCLKPYDEKTTLQIAKGAQLMVTVEDHYVTGGLGTCVAEAFAAAPSAHPALLKLGVQDIFGESGEPDELYEKFGISAKAITARVAAALRERAGAPK